MLTLQVKKKIVYNVWMVMNYHPCCISMDENKEYKGFKLKQTE